MADLLQHQRLQLRAEEAAQLRQFRSRLGEVEAQLAADKQAAAADQDSWASKTVRAGGWGWARVCGHLALAQACSRTHGVPCAPQPRARCVAAPPLSSLAQAALREELGRTHQVAAKLDAMYRIAEAECSALRVDFKAQEDDRQLLIK